MAGGRRILLLSKRWQQKLPQLTEQEARLPVPAHPGALANTVSLFCQNSRPPSPSCPRLHLLLLSEADLFALTTSCLLPKRLRLSIPEGEGSGVHTSKKSQHRSTLTREAREKRQRSVSTLYNSMENGRFSINPRQTVRSQEKCDPYRIEVFIQAFS